MAKRFLSFLLLILAYAAPLSSFEKVIIWGHKLHTHTHSYIHERFYRAFKHLGYETYWFDDKDDVSGFDFSNSLFLTEGQVDKKMPLRDDCYYMVHNWNPEKYRSLREMGRCIVFQVYTDDVLARHYLTKIAPCIYYDIPGKCVYMPWASDLLPHEIEEMKRQLPFEKKKKIYWMGTVGGGTHGNADELSAFTRACKENGISFISNDPWSNGLGREALKERTCTSYLTPAIVGSWQQKAGYIPCRIFINISCGQMGVTNSYRVYELFEKKIIYNPDSYQLFYDAKDRLKTWTMQDQLELMDFVKTKHTYLNRVQTLLDFFKLVNPSL